MRAVVLGNITIIGLVACNAILGYDQNFGPAIPDAGDAGDAAAQNDSGAIDGTSGDDGGESDADVDDAPSEGPSHLPPVTALALGNGFTCVIFNGAPWCWGNNTHGELGNGEMGLPNPKPAPVKLDPNPSRPAAVGIAAGDNFACALFGAGLVASIACWGQGSTGQLGNNAPVPYALNPVEYPAPGVVKIAAGGTHACRLHEDLTLACWGSNESGEVGDGTKVQKNGPTQVSIDDVTDVAAGPDFTCAISEGLLSCWGANDAMQLARGDAGSPNPMRGNLNLPISRVTAGTQYACALQTSGLVTCWGALTVGADNIGQFSAGAHHICALTGAYSAECWGDNADGELGNGYTDMASTPVPVKGLDHMESCAYIAAGTSHSCAILSNGAMKCWGSNSHGELGTTVPFMTSLTPADVDFR